MIKILHYGLSENRGGIETYLYKISKGIDMSRFQFEFLDMNSGEAALKEELEELGGKFYKITPRRVSLKKNRRELEELFCKEKFDVFHCHINTLSYILPIKLALKYGCTVIVHSRNAGAVHQLRTMVLHYIHFVTLPKSKIKMLAVSDEAGKWLFGRGAEYQVLNNGVDIERFRFKEAVRIRLRNEYALQGRIVIGVVGAFLPAKNHLYVLEIFKTLRQLSEDVTLLLVGDGRLKKYIEMKCKENKIEPVLFTGNRTDVNELYSAMDVLLMPSFFEGFPNVCMEAQTSGLPCIVSDVITREVDATNICYLSLREKPNVWAKAIKMAEKESRFADRRLAADIIRRKGFSVEEEINKLERIYLKLL